MTERTVQKEEYAALHNEATSCMRELAQLERACVLGALAVFAWLAAKAELLVGFAGLAWMLPVAIAIYGSLKGLAIRRHLRCSGATSKSSKARSSPASGKSTSGGDGRRDAGLP